MIEEFKDYSLDVTRDTTDELEKLWVSSISESVIKNLPNLPIHMHGDYIASRRHAVKACLYLLTTSLDYICGIDGSVNYYSIEKDLLSGFAKDYGLGKSQYTHFDNLTDSYTNTLFHHACQYGHSEDNIKFKLNKIIAKQSSLEL